MPTTYPKCSPTEMMGLLVLLNDHKGAEDVARLADDLDLEIDEILPSLDFAEALSLVKIDEGRATFTEAGRRLVQVSIRERKTILRDQLRKTTLFKTLLRALENSPERRLTEDEVHRILAFTTAPGDAFVQNIINWGRYAELFRYDSNERALFPAHPARGGKYPPSTPPGGPSTPSGRPEANEGVEEDSASAASRSVARPPQTIPA